MAEHLNGYFSSVFTKEDISSLPVADAKFQEAKSDYLGPLVVTPEMVAKKIKAMKDTKSRGVDTTVKEKDLGVTISADMNVSEQCGIAASKGNQIIGLIRRNITYKGKKLIIPLYKAIVRPHLEYCIQAWIPYRKKDIDTLERIQRRATKMISELRDLSYEERLKDCGLTTLETRRLRGDQIEIFKILNGYENIDINMFFSLKKDSRTRGHEVKLVKDQCRLDIRKHSFVLTEDNK